jgi:uncharacterized protein YdiU (UPF0061 family)
MTRELPDIGWKIEANYARLPSAFWEAASPARFPEPRPVVWNEALADELGLQTVELFEDDRARFATGQVLPPGAVPIAQAYAGHQYGHGTMLGDGRAILVGEQRTPTGALVDIHLKGAGQTPFSRRGDGRAALGPMLREFLVSESMHALGIPTTRSLAVATTGEMIPRDGLQRGAVLVRTASSHLRVGTFEYAAALGDRGLLEGLTRHAIARHDADLAAELATEPAIEPDLVARFLSRVVGRQAELLARWQSVGFVHGVMNTDNMTISGETIDYGPCAFMDAYDPNTVFSSIDRFGRYRYGQQPGIAHWNLARLAESLLPLLDADAPRAIDRANEILAAFPERYERAWRAAFRAKLGLTAEEAECAGEAGGADDAALIRDMLAAMHAGTLDFTNTFRALTEGRAAASGLPPAWIERWRARLLRESSAEMRTRVGDELTSTAVEIMRAANPAIIPRNHRVEEALDAAEMGDLAPFEALVSALRRPFNPGAEDTRFREPAPVGSERYQTFCGT